MMLNNTTGRYNRNELYLDIILKKVPGAFHHCTVEIAPRSLPAIKRLSLFQISVSGVFLLRIVPSLS